MLLNLGVYMDLEGLCGGIRDVIMLHWNFIAADGTMHECKAKFSDDFQEKNCVWLGDYRRVGIASGMHTSDVSPPNYTETLEWDYLPIRNNPEFSQCD